MKFVDQNTEKEHKEYCGELDAVDAATGMQATRINAVDLYETAEKLLGLKIYAHSLVFATLAIEEMGKRALLFSIFLGVGGRGNKWRGFRQHTVKTAGMNKMLVALAKAYFPDIDEETLAAVNVGPSPKLLELKKQMALYSDCFTEGTSVIWHLPRNINWQSEAEARLSEAKAIVLNARDENKEELSILHKHIYGIDKDDESIVKFAIEAVNKELVEKGYKATNFMDIIVNLT